MINLGRLIGSFGSALVDCCGVPLWVSGIVASLVVYGGFVVMLRTLQWWDER